VRLDDTIFKYPYDALQAGVTIYVKFLAFNIFARAKQTLADVSAYSIVLNPGAPPELDVVTKVRVTDGSIVAAVGTVAKQESNNVNLSGGVIQLGPSGAILAEPAHPDIPMESQAVAYMEWNTTNFSTLPDLAYGGSGGSPSDEWLVGGAALLFANGDETLATPLAQRIRAGTVRFVVRTAGTVDTFISIWVSQNGAYPTILGNPSVAPASGSDLAIAEYSDALTIADGDTVQFYSSIAGTNGLPFSGAHRDFIDAFITVTFNNF
jgi:hypothetical protein